MRRAVILVVVAVSITALTGAYLFIRNNPSADRYHPPSASPEALIAVGNASVLFAHQSVGGNILSGIPAVYEAHGLPSPEFVELAEAGPEDNLVHLRIGENGDPLGKIEAFDSLIRDGLGDNLDVAVLKLCYTDVRHDDDVDAIFAAYRDTLATLQEDYPDVTFVATSVPLQVKRGPLGIVKAWLGRGDHLGAENNATREDLNALIRAEYADTDLFLDVASIESSKHGGDRVTGRHAGEVYFSLNKAYAKDHGHLNTTGAAVTAESFLAVVATGLQG